MEEGKERKKKRTINQTFSLPNWCLDPRLPFSSPPLVASRVLIENMKTLLKEYNEDEAQETISFSTL